jgi:hypothetical protein
MLRCIARADCLRNPSNKALQSGRKQRVFGGRSAVTLASVTVTAAHPRRDSRSSSESAFENACWRAWRGQGRKVNGWVGHAKCPQRWPFPGGSVREAARAWGVSRSTAARWINAGSGASDRFSLKRSRLSILGVVGQIQIPFERNARRSAERRMRLAREPLQRWPCPIHECGRLALVRPKRIASREHKIG